MGIFSRRRYDDETIPPSGGIFRRFLSATQHVDGDYTMVRMAKTHFAVQTGYVMLGWKTADYLKSAIGGGFECLLIWGKPGSGKSNFARQLLYQIYEDWDRVLSCTVTGIPEFIEVAQKRENKEDLPAIVIDDISRTLPRQLWQINRELYISMDRALQVIRSIFNVVIVTVPSLEYVPTSILNIATMETHVTPKHQFFTERWLPRIKFELGGQFIHRSKVLVDTGVFDLFQEPIGVFLKYNEKRRQMAEDAIKALKEALTKSGKRRNAEEESEIPPPKPTVDFIKMRCQFCGYSWRIRPTKRSEKAKCPYCKSMNPITPQNKPQEGEKPRIG